MAQSPSNMISLTPVARTEAPPEAGMYEVTLQRIVHLNGHDYLPRYRQVVDQATLDAMGDAVVHAKLL